MERINCSSSYVSQEPKICVPRGQGTQKEEEGEKKKKFKRAQVRGWWVGYTAAPPWQAVCMHEGGGGWHDVTTPCIVRAAA